MEKTLFAQHYITSCYRYGKQGLEVKEYLKRKTQVCTCNEWN